MKFLIHIPQLIYGGAEKVLVNFANYLVQKGHKVEILETYERGLLKPQFDERVRFNAICSIEYTKKYYASLADIKSDRSPVGKVLKLGKLAFSKVVGYRRFAEKLAAEYYKDKRYDVAINYLEIEDPRFVLNNIKADKYFQWIHIDAERLKPGELDENAKEYERMSGVVCVAETAKGALIRLYPSLRDKTYVIYNFFNTEMMIQKAKDEVSFDNSLLSILSIGRMVEQKGYLRAIEVINKLKREGYKFKWSIIGAGDERRAIEQKIVEYNLGETVELLGLKDNPYPYIKQCDLFLLPSIYEGFPTVTIEAKVLGKAVMATEVSGIREQIEDGKNGLIVENSEHGIYEGLKRILDEPELLEKLSDNSGMDAVLDNDLKYEQFMKLVER